ncbi:FAD-binding domain-containing protein 57 [Elsinoe fawcettii]|nr:FAD-binding domain-containing protein 57 [Elsinoe fawcettii]
MHVLTVSSLVAACALASAAPSISVCKQLQAKFPDTLYPLNSLAYQTAVTSVWSETCLTTPLCAFEPNSAQDLADGLAIIVTTKTRFAVRSVGHMPVPLSNGVNDGVLISMSRFNQKTLIDDNTVVQIGPGQTWADVYEYTSPFGKAVAGGRFSPVGVGGLLLGGGINFFGSQHGWSFNSIINYEVVLANSSIVNANAQENADLFWALKGGGNNFGIVTRFDLKTIPATQIYGGSAVYAPGECDGFLDAISAYTQPDGGSSDVKTAILPNIIIDPNSGAVSCANLFFYDGDDPAPAAFANFSALTSVLSTTSVRPNFVAYTADTDIETYSSRASRRLFASTAIKVSPETVNILNQTFTDNVSRQLAGLSDKTNSTVTLAIQPITRQWLQAAKDAGGDAIDLDPTGGPFITALFTAQWENPSDDKLIRKIANGFIDRLDKAAKTKGLSYPFRYMNDAVRGEQIYQGYGGGKSLPRLKKIQKQYDPKGVLDRYFNSGFKL